MRANPQRARLIDATTSLLKERGYYGTALADILALSESPKGSLYHYFPAGKDELVIAALQASSVPIQAVLAAAVTHHDSPTQATRRLIRHFKNELETSQFRKGCPIAATAVSVHGNETIRGACAQIYAGWEAGLARFLRAHGMRGNLKARARTILTLIEGALLLCKTHRTLTYLEDAEAQILASL